MQKPELVLVLIPFIAFLVTWTFLCVRLAEGKGLLPKQNPLHRARWRGDTCLLILGAFVAIPSFALAVMMFLTQENPTGKSGGEPAKKAVVVQENDSQTEHSALVFLEKNPSPLKFLFMAAYIALVAPFFEEFIFRLIIQGWFDAREREIFRRKRGNGWRSVILVAIMFSFIHFRAATPTYPSEHELGIQFGTLAITSILILVFSIWLLKGPLGLNWREIGLDFRFWKKDLCLGALGFGAAAEVTYLLQAALAAPLKNYCAPDFIALIPIALVFGILYWRTRRLLPGFTAHAIFNGFSILQLFTLYLTK